MTVGVIDVHAHVVFMALNGTAGRYGPEGGLGTLEPGSLADLVIVKGNPHEDIKVLQTADNILAVMKGGQIFSGLLDPCSPHQKSAEQLRGLLEESLCN